MNLENLRHGPSREAEKKVLASTDIIGCCDKMLDVGCGAGSFTLEFEKVDKLITVRDSISHHITSSVLFFNFFVLRARNSANCW